MLHFVAAYDGHELLEDYLDSFERWTGWQKWGNKDRFPKKYIISFMNLYTKPCSSLFGGIFEVVGRHWELAETDPSNFYDVQFVEDYSEYIVRLTVETPRADNSYDSIKVLGILPAPYGYNVS